MKAKSNVIISLKLNDTHDKWELYVLNAKNQTEAIAAFISVMKYTHAVVEQGVSTVFCEVTPTGSYKFHI
jgi:hypothetical protein